MSTYNEKKEWLIKSIDSILNQTYTNFEFIIIIDNPLSKEIISLIDSYKVKDERIRYFVNKKNEGLVYSLNIALSVSRGNYIARMDADDISNQRRLQIQLDYMIKYNIDIVGSNIIYFNENDNIKQSTLLLEDNDIKDNMKYWSQLAHPTWFIRKEVYDKLNGYRDIKYCEDYDFLLRAMKNNYTLANIEQPLLKYRINIKGISRSNLLEQRLISQILSNNFDRINTLTMDEIQLCLDRYKITNRKKSNYEKANSIYQNYCTEQQFIKKYYYLFKSFICSYTHFKLEYLPQIKRRMKRHYNGG